MKNIIIVTGGAGFVGSNLIELLLKKTNYQIIPQKTDKNLKKPQKLFYFTNFS